VIAFLLSDRVRAVNGANIPVEGGPVMTPQVLSLIRAVFVHERDRARAVGAYGASIGAGVIAGLAGGGLLLDLDVAGLGWRMIFLINVPIGAAILCAAVPAVSESRSADLPRLDIAGAAFTAVLLPLVLIPLLLGGEHGWPWWTYLCFVLGAAGVLAFLRWERRTETAGNDPLLPGRLLRARGFPLSMGTVLMFFSGNAGLFLVLTYHLRSGLRQTPLAASLVFVPLGLGFIVASAACRRLAARFGIGVSVAGGLVMAAGLVAVPAVTGLDRSDQAVALAAVMGVSGLGQGLVVAPLVDTVLTRATRARVGCAEHRDPGGDGLRGSRHRDRLPRLPGEQSPVPGSGHGSGTPRGPSTSPRTSSRPSPSARRCSRSGWGASRRVGRPGTRRTPRTGPAQTADPVGDGRAVRDGTAVRRPRTPPRPVRSRPSRRWRRRAMTGRRRRRRPGGRSRS
jgi:predicted MFS family arabinose efflux permease